MRLLNLSQFEVLTHRRLLSALLTRAIHRVQAAEYDAIALKVLLLMHDAIAASSTHLASIPRSLSARYRTIRGG
jgi:hypothetical protein